MDASTPLSADLQRQQDRKRKRKAILAGGVVLGLGAAVTLAAWSDDVFANGTFNTGTFDIEGSADGSTWDDYNAAADAGPLSFTINALQMSPDETVYAPFSIRTVAGTSLPGEVTLTGTIATGAYAGLLTYEIFDTGEDHGANCDPDESSALIGPWAPSTLVTATAPTTDPVAIGADTATPANLCIAVTLADQAAVEAVTDNPEATSVTWEFNGLSTDAA